MIVPIAPGAEETPALLALLADEPMMTDGRAELLLVAAEPEARMLAGRWRALAAFHDLTARLVGLAAPAVQAAAALTVGADRARADQPALPCARRIAEHARLARATLRRVCRPSGSGRLEPNRALRGRYSSVRRRHAGQSWRADHRPPSRPVHARCSSLPGECLLIDRRTLAMAGGLPQDLSDDSLAPLALAGQLAAAGIGCFWLPDVRLLVADYGTGCGRRPVSLGDGLPSILDRRALARRHPDLAAEPASCRPRRCRFARLRSPASMPLALVVSHGHPAFSVGGAEVASYNLHRGLQDAAGGWRGHYLARVGPPLTPHRGTPLMAVPGAERETLYLGRHLRLAAAVQP